MATEQGEAYDPSSLPNLLNVFYKRLFPYGPYYRWMSYGGVPKSTFQNREFTFTLEGDVYVRYQSFMDQRELEDEVVRRVPHKIDIGAVYSNRPRDHKTAAAFTARERELVFDIDMTDYDDIRTCCEGAAICARCWPFMTVAAKILDRALREDFGFAHLLWVYSGRRGIHCWVCDPGARALSQQARSAVAEYLQVIKGGDSQAKKVTLPAKQQIHPSIKKALEVIRAHFDELVVKNQDFLGTDDLQKKFLQLVPDDQKRDDLEILFAKCRTSAERWAKAQALLGGSGGVKRSPHLVEEILLQYTYPRLDINVSKGLNHLLKSPFCVHPKTGKVCVPIDMAAVDAFDPAAVPTITQLCREIDAFDSATPAPAESEEGKENDEGGESGAGETEPKVRKRKARYGREYTKTSLNDSVQVLERFLQNLQTTWKGKLMEKSDTSGDF